jgi:predicted KAP-like P-loop ATPase
MNYNEVKKFLDGTYFLQNEYIDEISSSNKVIVNVFYNKILTVENYNLFRENIIDKVSSNSEIICNLEENSGLGKPI